MKTSNLLSKMLMGLMFALVSTAAFAGLPKKNITAAITGNRFFSNDTIYNLKGYIYVMNNATLTIEAGTVITGDSATKGALIITTGSKIQAIGTPCQPIVFTSAKKKKARGDWAGLVLLGKSALNNTSPLYGFGYGSIEGITPSDTTKYGGGSTPDIHDNSGTLQYVRIEFAGIALSPNNELNGLTLGAVGDGTSIDYVQVSFANDDSFEWFGGTVNAKHLIAFRGLDDDFDTDNGFSGKVQFAMGLRDPKVADISGSKAFESDNDATGSLATPQTRPVFCNVTVTAGSDSATNTLFNQGAHIRRNSHIYIDNSIIMGFPKGGLLIDGTTTQSNVAADTLVKNSIIASTQSSKWLNFTPTPNPTATADSLLLLANNGFYLGNAAVKLKNPYALGAPKYQLLAGSPAINAATFNHPELNDPFFTKVKYVGAFSDKAAGDWTKTWAAWTPNNIDYSNGVPLGTGCTGAVTAPEQVISVSEVSTAKVSVTPNPSNGTFSLNVSGIGAGKASLKIANLNTGIVVYQNSVSNGVKNITLNAGAGLYVATITYGNQTISTRINIIK